MGLLSHTISVQSLEESIPKNLSLERKAGGGRGAREEGGVLSRCSKREREGEGVRGFLTPTTLNPKD